MKIEKNRNLVYVELDGKERICYHTNSQHNFFILSFPIDGKRYFQFLCMGCRALDSKKRKQYFKACKLLFNYCIEHNLFFDPQEKNYRNFRKTIR